ncbi:MAG: HNH endonuclease [Treponema sp.]|jgi:hypothetical protein|nr:HNH endonuclease [Treponema sp.]
MVKLHKSPLPVGVTIKSGLDYRKEPVFSIIKDDCNNKCYICEEKGTTSMHVEHRVSQSFDPSRKYDWNNLLLSCGHCNRVKGSRYNTILDCTRVDPEAYISLRIAIGLYERVTVIKIGERDGVDETIRLLDTVYNGESTAILKYECKNLRAHVLAEVQTFQQLLDGYFEENDTALKEAFQRKISESISRASNFASFKRGIIKNNDTLFALFKDTL